VKHAGWFLVVSGLASALAAAEGAEPPRSHARTETTTQEAFDRAAPAVVRLEIVEGGSGARATIGTGFFVDGEGSVATNFHVVAQVVHHPSRYRIRWERRDGSSGAARLAAIDVVHDVAVLRADDAPGAYLALADRVPAQGARLFSLGYPHDLGLSIVEGTFNGYLDHSLYQKIHFTGSLNPGMSGGPTLDASGRVIGVNVSTAGNQVSFLVPVTRVRALLEEVRAPAFAPPAEFLPVVREQLLRSQDAYVAKLLEEPLPTVDIAPFRLPAKMAPFVKCWADARREGSDLHEVVNHECSTDDWVYVSSDQFSGVVEYRHHVVTTEELNPFRFASLYEQHLQTPYGSFAGSEESVTRFRCRSGVVERDGTKLQSVACLRAYRKLPGLHDYVLKVAVLGDPQAGAESALALSGVTVANARRVTQRFMEAIAWSR